VLSADHLPTLWDPEDLFSHLALWAGVPAIAVAVVVWLLGLYSSAKGWVCSGSRVSRSCRASGSSSRFLGGVVCVIAWIVGALLGLSTVMMILEVLFSKAAPTDMPPADVPPVPFVVTAAVTVGLCLGWRGFCPKSAKRASRPSIPVDWFPTLRTTGRAPGFYPARAGGLWLRSTLVRSRFHAVVVPSGLRTSDQPIRWIMT